MLVNNYAVELTMKRMHGEIVVKHIDGRYVAQYSEGSEYETDEDGLARPLTSTLIETSASFETPIEASRAGKEIVARLLVETPYTLADYTMKGGIVNYGVWTR